MSKKRPGLLRGLWTGIGTAVVCALVIWAAGCGGESAVSVSVSESYETTAPEAASTSAPEAETVEDAPLEIPIETCLSAIETVLASSYGENYQVTLDGDVVTVGVWVDGIALGAMAAVSDDEDAVQAWNTVMDTMVSLADSIQGVLVDCGHGDMTALVNVVNDLDTDSVLASITDGTVVYDAVNGIDLLGVSQ